MYVFRGRVGRKTTSADLLPLSTVRSSLLTGRFPPHHLRSSAECANDMTTRIALWRLRLLALTPTSPLVFGFFAVLASVCTLATSSSVQMVVAVLACLLSVRLMQGQCLGLHPPRRRCNIDKTLSDKLT